MFCKCETPIMDVEHDAGCQRCGLPVDFSPKCDGCGTSHPWLRFGTARVCKDCAGYIAYALRGLKHDGVTPATAAGLVAAGKSGHGPGR